MYSQEEAKPEAVYWYLHKRVPLIPLTRFRILALKSYIFGLT
jgi:hypothetical protein